jgi:hypothetical protein
MSNNTEKIRKTVIKKEKTEIKIHNMDGKD